MKEEKENKGFAHIGSIVDKVLNQCRCESDMEMTEVWRLWESAVGKAIAENARPAAFKGRMLLVHVTSSTWIHELQFLKKDIIRKVNDALGEEQVEEIKFKIGPI